MKKYKVTIDLESFNYEVEAENQEEAKQKALDLYKKESPEVEDFWVGDIEEVEK